MVFSRTLRQEDHPEVTIVSEDPEQALTDLRSRPGGKDIWLFGGGTLFRSLLEARQVDAVEVSVIPVLLGEGIRLLAPTPSSERFKLKLTGSRTFKTGIVSLEYAVEYEPANSWPIYPSAWKNSAKFNSRVRSAQRQSHPLP
jgi:dihydrofolate reductase